MTNDDVLSLDKANPVSHKEKLRPVESIRGLPPKEIGKEEETAKKEDHLQEATLEPRASEERPSISCEEERQQLKEELDNILRNKISKEQYCSLLKIAKENTPGA